MYACAGFVRKGQGLRSSEMSHISANHATAVGVITQPPMPTFVSSAQASAAARHCRVEGIASGLCGLWEMVAANHLRLSTLSRRRRVCEASGLEARINCTLAVAGISGRSDLQCNHLPLYSRMRAPGGMKSPLGQAGSCRSLLRAERKVCQSGAGTAYWLPGGLYKSAYRGARCGRR